VGVSQASKNVNYQRTAYGYEGSCIAISKHVHSLKFLSGPIMKPL
jgi:hypothetical protein